MGVNLRGVKLLVTENIFKNAHVNVSALIHKCCGGMAKLMNGEVLCLKSCEVEIFINHPLNSFDAYSLIKSAQKEGFCLHVFIFWTQTDFEIIVKHRSACLVEIDNPFFVTLTENA